MKKFADIWRAIVRHRALVLLGFGAIVCVAAFGAWAASVDQWTGRDGAARAAARECAVQKCDVEGRERKSAQAISQVEARVMTNIALVQLMVSALGLAFVGGALLYSSRANRLASEISIAERRPWITVEITSVKVVAGPDKDFLTVAIRLKNVGLHPATSIRIGCQQFRTEGVAVLLDSPGIMIRELGPDTNTIGYTLFPQEEMTDHRMISIKRGREFEAYIGGYAAYRASLTKGDHFTPWAVRLHYRRGGVEEEVEATLEPFYITTEPT